MGEPVASATASIPARDSFGLRLRYACSWLLFFLGYRVFGLRRATIRLNLRRSFPDKSDAERERMRNEFVTRQSEILAELDYSRVMSADELRVAFAPLLSGRPAGEVVHQCGSGVSACHNLLAMEVAGLPGARVYAGSWSGWISDPSRPVATGD